MFVILNAFFLILKCCEVALHTIFFYQLIRFFCIVSYGQLLNNRKTLPNVMASLLPGMQKEMFAEVNTKNDNDYTLMAH